MAKLGDFRCQGVGVGSSLSLLIVACVLSPSTSADLGTVQGVQWSPHIEWTVDNSTWSGNAFDVRAMVEFTHASSGDTVRTGMFFSGGNTWAFRFTATRTGTWSFVTSSDEDDLAGHTGRGRVGPNPRADAHGVSKRCGTKWGGEGAERRTRRRPRPAGAAARAQTE